MHILRESEEDGFRQLFFFQVLDLGYNGAMRNRCSWTMPPFSTEKRGYRNIYYSRTAERLRFHFTASHCFYCELHVHGVATFFFRSYPVVNHTKLLHSKFIFPRVCNDHDIACHVTKTCRESEKQNMTSREVVLRQRTEKTYEEPIWL